MIYHVLGNFTEPKVTEHLRIIVNICSTNGLWDKEHQLDVSHKWPVCRKKYIMLCNRALDNNNTPSSVVSQFCRVDDITEVINILCGDNLGAFLVCVRAFSKQFIPEDTFHFSQDSLSSFNKSIYKVLDTELKNNDVYVYSKV